MPTLRTNGESTAPFGAPRTGRGHRRWCTPAVVTHSTAGPGKGPAVLPGMQPRAVPPPPPWLTQHPCAPQPPQPPALFHRQAACTGGRADRGGSEHKKHTPIIESDCSAETRRAAHPRARLTPLSRRMNGVVTGSATARERHGRGGQRGPVAAALCTHHGRPATVRCVPSTTPPRPAALTCGAAQLVAL